ncbi:MAG: competence protein ComEC family protein, partial [Muribaculaceae bacterium]|nr:competence protein ComEC family protein [Muribaculaceae bacterium]
MKSVGASMPALPVALGLGAGIAVYGALSVSPWIGLALAVAGIAFARLLKRTSASAVFALGLGILVSWNSRPSGIPPNLVGENTSVSGRVDAVTMTDLTTRIVITPDFTPSAGRLLAIYRGAAHDIRPGMTVEVSGKITVPDSVTDLPLQTDFNRYLKLDGIVGRMNVYSRSDLRVTDSSRSVWDRFRDTVRSGWLDAIVSAGFDEPTTAFMLAVLGGDDMLLDTALEERFRDNGLAHLLAISGMHLALIVMLLGWMLYAMKFSITTRRIYYIVLMIAVGLFTVAAGGSPSVCRAAVMALVMLGCGLFETPPDPRQ